ncbi:amino acid/amide ABC transporter substrate-binding protein, HAAT family [Rhizobiales bacterium GAS188]|nr:amino acid/amide ABC transporter substrate-binding protein, HAAT family [Rhizobiales bacterium GAS188]
MRRRSFLASLALVTTPVAMPSWARAEEASGDTVLVGVSGPLTGQYAQYGAQWKRGFDLAIDHANAQGGVKGRKLGYVFEDSQSDPRQSVAIAQKFVGNPEIVMELGDFSSAASMAASPIYQRGGLVQFGFTNSHPDFTKGGDYMWSDAPNQADDMPHLADYAINRLGLKKLGILYINGDWGRTSRELMLAAAKQRGATIVASEGYLPNEKDFRSTLVRVRDASPDGIILISYYPDGALIVRQMRDLGMAQPVVAAGSIYSPKFLEIAGDAANIGIFTETNFFPEDPRPEAQAFMQGFKAKYGMDPDSYAARSYDAMIVAWYLAKTYGPDRKAIHDGLGAIKDIPSVIYGRMSFEPGTRRVAAPMSILLTVKDSKFAQWKGN